MVKEDACLDVLIQSLERINNKLANIETAQVRIEDAIKRQSEDLEYLNDVIWKKREEGSLPLLERVSVLENRLNTLRKDFDGRSKVATTVIFMLLSIVLGIVANSMFNIVPNEPSSSQIKQS